MPDNQSSPYLKLYYKKKLNEVILFDSGSDGLYDVCLINYKLLSKYKVFCDSLQGFGALSAGMFGVEEETKKLRLFTKSLKICESEIRNVWLDTNSDKKSKIGIKLLDYGKITIDYKHKKFYFEAFETSQEYKDKSWSFGAIPNDGKCYITFVLDKIADKINIGDELTEIDGEKVNLKNVCDLIHNNPLRDKTEAVITLKEQDGTVKKIKVFKE